MQTNNPFDLILSRLDQLQSTVNNLTANNAKTPGPPGTNPERLLDLAEAAEIVRKPIGTVRYYIHHRNLPATKIGKSYLVKLGELLKWVETFDQRPGGKKTAADRMLDTRIRYRKS
jgi:excisionase family DNA binding protein